jgi:hypothetical protein
LCTDGSFCCTCLDIDVSDEDGPADVIVDDDDDDDVVVVVEAELVIEIAVLLENCRLSIENNPKVVSVTAVAVATNDCLAMSIAPYAELEFVVVVSALSSDDVPSTALTMPFNAVAA